MIYIAALAAVLVLVLIIIAVRRRRQEESYDQRDNEFVRRGKSTGNWSPDNHPVQTTDEELNANEVVLQPPLEDEPMPKPAVHETEIMDAAQELERLPYTVGAAQIQGDRDNQEDCYAISNWKDVQVVRHQGLLAAVADGIGGLDNGEAASGTLMRTFVREFSQLDPAMTMQQKLLELTARGQQEVLALNRAGKRCGTTLVCVLIENGSLAILSVGDSRILLYRAGALLQLNREHVLARESDEYQALVDAGEPGNQSKRGALTAYIGKEGLRTVDRTLNPMRLISGDRLLLLSDGVFGTLSDDELIAFINQDAQETAEAIVRAVQAHGRQGQDNATVVIISVE